MIRHQEILDSIKTTLQTILIANGYHTDLGLNVYVNKANSIISSSNDDALNIKDVALTALTAKTGGMVNFFDYTMLVEISIHFKGATAITKIREGIWDVQKAIGTNIKWDDQAINTYPPEGSEFIQMVFEQEENTIVGAKINIIVEFRTKQWNEDEVFTYLAEEDGDYFIVQEP